MHVNLAIFISITAGVLLGVVSNWLYDVLKNKGLFPDNPTRKHVAVGIAFFIPFVVLVGLPGLLPDKSAVDEEEVINSLTAGLNVAVFEERLGTPLFLTESDNNYIEYVFRRNGYWIQAIADQKNTVHLYSVTVCDENFRPTITLAPLSPITLGATTYAEVSDNPVFHYFISGATADSFLLEEQYLGNPGNYQTLFWGWKDVCGFPEKYYEIGRHVIATQPNIRAEDPIIASFRKSNVFNTFAITRPNADTESILQGLPLGVSRQQIRTYQPSDE